MKTRIAILDDHEIVIQGLRALLQNTPGFHIVATYDNGLNAIEDYERVEPDVLLVDINMPIINGFDTATRLLGIYPEAKIIMISMEVKMPYVKKALEEGIKGFVSKSADIDELIHTIQSVSEGGMCFNDYLETAPS